MGVSKARKQESVETEPASKLREIKAVILDAWKERVREHVPSAKAEKGPALVDSMPDFIDRLVEAMANSRSEREKAFQAALTGAEHGEQRAEMPDYTLDQVLIEYRILREVIFDVLRASNALTESAVDSIDDSIQVGMSAASTEFLRLRVIREASARREADELNRRMRGLQSVTDSALASTPSLQSLLYELLARVRQVFGCDTVVILLLDQKKESLMVSAAHGLEEDVKRELMIPLGSGIAGRIYDEKKAMIFDDLSKVEIYSPILKEKSLKSLMGAPLRTGHGVLGVIHVGTLQMRTFSKDEAILLQMIGDRIAVAIENSRLYEERQKDIASLLAAQSQGKRFLSILTHDIRNPMASAQLLASMLRKRADQPEVVRSLSQRISQALGRSDKLIQDLLDVNLILNQERLILEPEKVNLQDLIAEALVPMVMLNGDRFILQGDRPIEGHWSRRELSRVIELAVDVGVRLGGEHAPILISTLAVDSQARISVHFSGQIETPHTLSSTPPEGIMEVQAQRESRLSLSWTLIESFVQAHGGNVSLESSEKSGTEITVTIPRMPSYSV
jgi:GAF domain-containing protein